MTLAACSASCSSGSFTPPSFMLARKYRGVAAAADAGDAALEAARSIGSGDGFGAAFCRSECAGAFIRRP
jgi:hypothetical protein